MVELLVAFAVFLVSGIAELIHTARSRSIARLVFGPNQRPRLWASAAPWLRVFALSALAWGLTTLLLITPKVHRAATIEEEQMKHVVLVLDVSPSMRLDDAGPSKIQTRMNRPQDHFRLEQFVIHIDHQQQVEFALRQLRVCRRCQD